MLLAIDIGNSQIACGVFRDNALIADWRLSTDHAKTSDEYGMTIRSLLTSDNIHLTDIQDSIISSVVPPITQIFESLLHSLIEKDPIIVTSSSPYGLILRYEKPEEIGGGQPTLESLDFFFFFRKLFFDFFDDLLKVNLIGYLNPQGDAMTGR